MSGASPCAACRKRCCANYTVSINGYDVFVISKTLHLLPESYLIYFPVTDRNERGFLLDPGGNRYEIALDKAGHYQKGNPCIFWIELSHGGGRCGIYSHRPMVCQTYPAYQQQEIVVLRDDVLCPEGAWNLAGMELGTFRERLSRFRMQQDIYAYIVAAWNDAIERANRRMTVREYYTALLNIYESLDRWTADIPSEERNDFVRKWGGLPPASPNPLFADTASSEDDPRWRLFIAALREHIRGAAPWFAEARKVGSAAA